ncbi:DAK2 domain-containing protein [Nocardiopsis sp. NRRL B-16309]|uniref:DAK2 domain-containing protein n=1 Tax=Nocardiopsis sp. NRRL B-16309 TaxID=1519494 RepID=UPI0006AF21E2|nr:DAK2 domain-containing protein [Nocardiopsis sp. NRRL B-16309]KOX15542.1 Dak phosphatase [Nocardiopsis sp. NRRL B-16309]
MADQISPAHADLWVRGFAAAINDADDHLTDLDRRSGDGDFGTNMVTGLRRALAALPEHPDSPGAPFQALSDTFLSHSGGTSGPLFGMWFRDFAKAGHGTPALTLAGVAEAADRGWATVTRLGSAKVGDRTMVDAIAPAAESLGRSTAEGLSLEEGLRAAAEAAEAGAQGTSELLGRKGRTSYVGDAALGAPDPGAVAIGLFFRAAHASVTDGADGTR